MADSVVVLLTMAEIYRIMPRILVVPFGLSVLVARVLYRNSSVKLWRLAAAVLTAFLAPYFCALAAAFWAGSTINA